LCFDELAADHCFGARPVGGPSRRLDGDAEVAATLLAAFSIGMVEAAPPGRASPPR
jgi:hypothetical protein